MESCYDCLVVGAGFAGAVAAGELARRGGKKVLVLEQRDHVGGNAYDGLDDAGVLIHRYGPHIFHTNDRRVYEWLSQFTAWRPYDHRVLADLPGPAGGRMTFPVPFNLTSLETAFGPEEGKRLGEKLLAAYGPERKITILDLRANPDPEIAALADYVYEHVFVHYTVKQWGQRPEEIDPATTARVPVFLSRDDRYFQDRWQGMPEEGYTALFRRILDHPNLTLLCGCDARERLTLSGGEIYLDGVPFGGEVIWTGPVDDLFGARFGALPYRTLHFQFETLPQTWFQPCGTVNYTVDRPYTRITEFKHLTGQILPECTTILKEYAREYTGRPDEVPCYAVLNADSRSRYGRYCTLAEQYPRLHLLGRLAEYRYYNMDAIVSRALTLADALLGG